MLKQERFIAFICGISLAFVGSASAQGTVNDVQDYLGPRFHGTEQNAPSLNLPAPGARAADSLRLGPARASRAMAIVHIAMFDSVNRIAGGFRSYTNVRPARSGASMTTAYTMRSRCGS